MKAPPTNSNAEGSEEQWMVCWGPSLCFRFWALWVWVRKEDCIPACSVLCCAELRMYPHTCVYVLTSGKWCLWRVCVWLFVLLRCLIHKHTSSLYERDNVVCVGFMSGYFFVTAWLLLYSLTPKLMIPCNDSLSEVWRFFPTHMHFDSINLMCMYLQVQTHTQC